MGLFEYTLNTTRQEGMYNITRQLAACITESGVADGLAVIHCPHTTAAVTVNENADPDVQADLILGLRAAFPDRPDFRHGEGNSPAHLKSSCLGVTQTVIVRDGKPVLGTWQGVYFCEFDGPRQRRYFIKVSGDKDR